MSDWFADKFCCFLSYTTFQLGLKINNSNIFSTLACYIPSLYIPASIEFSCSGGTVPTERRQQSKLVNRQMWDS